MLYMVRDFFKNKKFHAICFRPLAGFRLGEDRPIEAREDRRNEGRGGGTGNGGDEGQAGNVDAAPSQGRSRRRVGRRQVLVETAARGIGSGPRNGSRAPEGQRTLQGEESFLLLLLFLSRATSLSFRRSVLVKPFFGTVKSY